MTLYNITKIDGKGNETKYGDGYLNPYDVIPKSYKFNGLFYENKQTDTIYISKEVKKYE